MDLPAGGFKLELSPAGKDYAMIIMGIDPGISGAIAIYDTSCGDVIVEDMPTVEVTRNGKVKREVSPQLLSEAIAAAFANQAFLERVGAMPGQGVSSTFSFGRTVGMIEGVLATLNIPTTIVPPTTWQRKLNVRGGKDGARERAMQLFPKQASLFSRKKDDGRADAALIAYYGSL
jgi:crossover junction endodeoxyribonuclease RuvC